MEFRQMNVKVIYTLNDKDQSPCLHRLSQPQTIKVATTDDGIKLGAVDLRTCLVAILEVSPELRPKYKEHDHAVYAYDYSEEDVPTVAQGRLSTILDQDSQEETEEIVGRIIKNPAGVFKKQTAETLEVKLKFVVLPSDSPLKKRGIRPTLSNTRSTNNSFADFMQASYTQPTASSPQYPMSSSPAYLQDVSQPFSRSNVPDTPASISLEDINQMFNSPIPSPTTDKGKGMSIEYSQHLHSRPASRHSNHAPTPPATSSTGMETREMDQEGDGPFRKRARLEQAPRPRSASQFGTQPRDAPLRRTASTTASIRHFRPHLSGAAQGTFGQETDGSNRAPTPRPQRIAHPAQRRMSSMSTLRHTESSEAPAASSPPESPSPAFTSSPPLRGLQGYYDNQQDGSEFGSSPMLLPYNNDNDDTGLFGHFELDFDLEMPSSDMEPHINIQLGSGPLQDSGIGLMSDDQIPATASKGTNPYGQPTTASDQYQANPKMQQTHSRERISQSLSRTNSFSLPNQKTQAEFAPGQHPLYRQRTESMPWNNFTPPGGSAPSQSINPKGTMNKAASSAAWRNKHSQPPQTASSTPMPMSSTPAPSSPSLPYAVMTQQQQIMPQPQQQGMPAYSPPNNASSPPFANLQSQGALTAPTPPAQSAQGQSKVKKTPPKRGRKALEEVSGNAEKVPIPRATTPKPNGPAPTTQAWTPGSKTGGAKRKRTAGKAPTKTTNDNDTPGGRAEKKAKLPKKPHVNEKDEYAFCITCGDILSSTWRNLYSRCFPGPKSPADLFTGEDKVDVHPNVDASGKILVDEQGHPKWYTVHKKNLSNQERDSGEWHTQKQCNGCGLYFITHGRLKIPDWQQLAAKDSMTLAEAAGANAPSQDQQQQQPQQNTNAAQHDTAPIDLTEADNDTNQPAAVNTTSAPDNEHEFDHLFGEPPAESTEDSTALSKTSTNDSTTSTEEQHDPLFQSSDEAFKVAEEQQEHQQEHQHQHDPDFGQTIDELFQSTEENEDDDKENTPPARSQASHSHNPDFAFDDLPDAGVEDGGMGFDDVWDVNVEVDWGTGQGGVEV